MRYLPILLLFLWSCQNQPANPATTPAPDTTATAQPTDNVATGRDTIIGVRGSERSRLLQENDDFVYTYAGYRIRVRPNNEEPGEKISFSKGNTGGSPTAVAVPEAGYFAGLSGRHLFIDAGTGPNGRELYIVDLESNREVYHSAYEGTAELQAGKLRFYVPVDASHVRPLPSCPEKDEWVRNGLGVGYAQLRTYDLQSGKEQALQQYMCFATQ
jgi:hypothetical protein